MSRRFSSKLDLPDPDRPRPPWRLLVYTVILGYLVADLFLIHGPLRRQIDAGKPHSAAAHAAARKHGWIARVNGTPLTRTQLERFIKVRNYKLGIDPDQLSPPNLELNRRGALLELVEDEILRQYADQIDPDAVSVSDEEIDTELERFRNQFESEEQLLGHLDAQFIDAPSLREHIAAHVKQIAYLEYRLRDMVPVSEEEARAWFDENHLSMELPERLRARHIFLSTVEDESDAPEQLARELHHRLTTREDSFENLARLHSEDQRNRHAGGDLNWFSRDRTSPDFFDAVAALEPGQVSPPFHTAIGWHIVELIGRQPPRLAAYDEVRDEILALLESKKREIAVERLMDSLKKGSIVEFFPENL